MTAFKDPSQGAAATTYLILFTFLAGIIITIMHTRRPRRRFVGLAIFILLRLGAQIAGIGFAIASYGNFNWLIAYFVLGAEGFFALVLSEIYILAAYQVEHFGVSWVHTAPPVGVKETPRERWRRLLKSPSFWFHQALIPANVLTVYGGTSQSGVSEQDFATSAAVHKGRVLRAVGQGLFLFLVQVATGAALVTLRQAQRKGRGLDKRPLYLVLSTWSLLTVRGAFGVLSSIDKDWSYYNPANYGKHGLSVRMVVGEYIMGTTMEFITACLLVYAGYLLTRPRGEAVTKSDGEEAPVHEKGASETL